METDGGDRRSIAVLYAFYYASLCSIFALSITYFPLFFRSVGFSPFQISVLSATGTLCTIFGSPFFQNLAFYLLPARLMVRVAPVLCALLFLPVATLDTFPPFLLFWALYFFILRAPASLVEAQAIRDSAEGIMRFEWVRAFGSLAFIFATFLLGALVDARGISSETTTQIGGAISVILVIACHLISRRLPEKRGVELFGEERAAGIKLRAPRSFWFLVLTLAVIWASHSVNSLYLPLYLQSLGARGKMIAAAYSMMVGAEILMFLFFSRLQQNFSLITILRVCIVLGAVRWLLLGLFPVYSVVLVVGALHAFSFAGTYCASLRLAHLLLPDILRDRGQATLAAGGSGAGALIGALGAGLAAQSLSSYAELHRLFLVSSFVMLLALVVSLFITLPDKE